MSDDPTPSGRSDAAPGASGEARSAPVPPDVDVDDDAPAAGSAPDGVSTASGNYPRSDGTAASDRSGDAAAESAAPESDAPETPVAAGGNGIRERLVSDPTGYQSRWEDIQAAFVDEPRRSVSDAAALVAEVIDEMTAAFARACDDLEKEWSGGDEVSTEDLRQAFRRYRSFFQRLLTTT